MFSDESSFLAILDSILSSSTSLTSLDNAIENQSDEVIFVSSFPREFVTVDLCSPSFERIFARPETVRRESEVVIIDSPSTSPKRACTASNSSDNPDSTLLSSTPMPSTTRSKSSTNEKDTLIARCPICLQSALRKRPVSTICGHVFCYDCINRCMEIMKKCPVCKQNISQKNIHNIFL